MAKISLIRADFRLIHGQVITKWLKQSNANRIVIIDDALSKDEFMAMIYVMAAPPGITVDIYSPEDATELWKKDEMGEGNLFILFKNIDQTFKAHQLGFPISELQIGGLGSGPGRKIVYGPITLDKPDVEKIKTMMDAGTHVYLHQVPDESKMEMTKVLENNKF